jgi:DNA-binding SARP family transcriptional activator/pimeloyl-ACP methyl ester carboxylesterase
MPSLKLFLFGSPRLEYQGEPIELNLRKAIALLVYIAVSKREFSRDQLAGLLWPENDKGSARANLRRTLYIINKSIGEEILVTGKDTICLNPHLELWTDVETFRESISDPGFDDEIQSQVPPEKISSLAAAVALYRGDFLAGFSIPDSPEFDQWQFFEAENLRRLLADKLNLLISAYETQGKFLQALDYARQWLSIDQLNEPAHRTLMRLYERYGQHSAALRQYLECERILAQELAVSPEPETYELYQLIRSKREIKQAVSFHRPEVKFVASRDVHIAYVEMGEGPPDILLISGFISHMEYIWELKEIQLFFDQLSSFSRVIFFDRRGVGLSDRIGYAPTLEDTLEDIQAVMRATGSKHPVLFGYLEGGPTSMLFTATYPQKVSGLILYGTRAKWTRSDNYPWTLTREQYDRWLQNLCENWGETLDLDTYAPDRVHDATLQNWWAKLMRLASSPGSIKAVLEVMRDIDVRDILPTIQTPTLIMQRRGDRAIRVGAGRHLAGQIPGAQYVELDGQDHWFFMGDSQSIIGEIQSFIQNLESPAIPPGMLATILMIELMEEPGESQAIQFPPTGSVSPYFLFQQEVSRFRGTEVSCKEGRYVATFDGPSRAIHCAKAIQKIAEQRNMMMRIGLHTGECEFISGELTGSAVLIVEDVLKSAGVNEVLASNTVKDLVVGSGIQFLERDKRTIEGVSGEWGVFLIM